MTDRICIFGASGGTGLELSRQAALRGFEVVAFVRSEAARGKLPSGVTTVVGSLSNQQDVERAISGCQAVICAFGARPDSPQAFCAEATETIIKAMKAQGASRLLCITGAMIGDYPHLSWFMRRMKSSYQKQQPALARDRAEQEKLVQESGLDWTVIKPPRLSTAKGGRPVRSGEDLNVGMMSTISRSDLSRFVLDLVESNQFTGKRLVVQY